MIEIENISYSYDGDNAPAIGNITLSIERGEHIAVIGPNGCGKTTLLRHLNGLLLPDEGTVLVDGMDTREKDKVREIRQKVGMVFQNPDNQIVGMTVEEDVAFGPGNLGFPADEISAKVKDALSAVGLGGFEKRAPYTLSAGEKQLVSMAGVLAMGPSCMALDEPTAHLSPGAGKRLLHVLERLNSEGMTLVHVSHDMDEVVGADRIILMDRGKLIATGTPSEIFSKRRLLEGLGLSLPTLTELFSRLDEMGLPVQSPLLTMDDALETLKEIINSPHCL